MTCHPLDRSSSLQCIGDVFEVTLHGERSGLHTKIDLPVSAVLLGDRAVIADSPLQMVEATTIQAAGVDTLAIAGRDAWSGALRPRSRSIWLGRAQGGRSGACRRRGPRTPQHAAR